LRLIIFIQIFALFHEMTILMLSIYLDENLGTAALHVHNFRTRVSKSEIVYDACLIHNLAFLCRH
jgi:hypothetical protein